MKQTIDMSTGRYELVDDKDGNAVRIYTTDNRIFRFRQYIDENGNAVNAVHLTEVTGKNGIPAYRQVTNDFDTDFANKLWYNVKTNPMTASELFARIENEGYFVID